MQENGNHDVLFLFVKAGQVCGGLMIATYTIVKVLIFLKLKFIKGVSLTR